MTLRDVRWRWAVGKNPHKKLAAAYARICRRIDRRARLAQAGVLSQQGSLFGGAPR